ncbi:hypothetical protein L1987_09244 [Smallanthus sonchifolius]|uniref:Uncharacterized protein n=1 Tax=Smallanthus sonchifolius TaxID=185202 RepID=A0ACB9JPI0_9ASTR|nr:hypothetical protein L1987_09244 [Smallanthus sonchifolius]
MDTTVIGSSEFIKVLSDTSVERFIPLTAPASLDLYNGYHHFLGDLSATSESIIISVDYRLAPENKLPIAYEDCYASLVWLRQQKPTEPWLQNADLSRVFLLGDSAGGNIAHHVAIRAIRDEECLVRIIGIIPIHPYFGSEKRTQLEMRHGSTDDVKSNDMFWRLSISEGLNQDYEGCNLEQMEVSESEWNWFPNVLVFVAGLDFLKERGEAYAEILNKKGVKEEKL